MVNSRVGSVSSLMGTTLNWFDNMQLNKPVFVNVRHSGKLKSNGVGTFLGHG